METWGEEEEVTWGEGEVVGWLVGPQGTQPHSPLGVMQELPRYDVLCM